MNRYPSSAERCERQFGGLEPWQCSSKLFDFDPAFVQFVQKHLQTVLKQDVVEVYRAKQYINGGKYDFKRLDDLHLLWETYQDSLKAASVAAPQPYFADAVVPAAVPAADHPPADDGAAGRERARAMLRKQGLIRNG